MANFGELIGHGLKKVFGSRNDRLLKDLAPTVGRVNELEPTFEKLSDAALVGKTAEFRQRLSNGESLDQLLPEAFAACRESAKRALGMRHFDVQILGGIILHQGKIVEMTTGEGKTLVATLPAYLNSLPEKGVHVITVNDYLAGRDAQWMSACFNALGVSVGAIQSNMYSTARLQKYACDITYGTNSEFGFDYLRDNMKMRLEDQTQKGVHNYAIIDEVDSILIDEARTPLIIAGQTSHSTDTYYKADAIVKQMREGEHFEVNEKDHHVVLTEEGIDVAQEIAGVGSFYDAQNIEWPHHIDQALKANHLYRRDKEYVVADAGRGPEIVIVDTFTGRQMPGRRWSDGLHQAVEAKEALRIREENQTLATITYQNFFRLYDKLSGMTGTAMTEAAEFLKIYNLDCVVMPTNRRLRRSSVDDLVYRTETEKFNAVADEIEHVHKDGRPVLVGTTSVEKSERLAKILDQRDLEYELLNAKQHEREANIIADAGQAGSITIATNMAGRGTDIILGPGIKDRGGLHVVGTERHEARRIDNQLRGRAGRQGDPGSSQFFLSLEDDLMRIFAKDWVGNMLGKLGMEEGQEIQSTMVTRMVERVQRKMEAHNFDIRKNLLEYDAVNNEQRTRVYAWRQSILEGKDQGDRVRWALEGVCSTLAEQFLVTEEKDALPDYAGLSERFEQRFKSPGPGEDELRGKNIEESKAILTDAAKQLYDTRVETFGHEHMKALERRVVLNTIDTKWKDNLQALDYLRTGVGMRGYGQEDPKIVYRRESADFFREMLSAIQETCTDLLFNIEPDTFDDSEDFDDDFDESELDYGQAVDTEPAKPSFDEDSWGPEDDTDWDTVLAEFSVRVQAMRAAAQAEQERRRLEAEEAQSNSVATATSSAPPPSVALSETGPQATDAGSQTAAASAHRERQKTAEILSARETQAVDPIVTRRAPKPNDPCPCGSAKKYKKCHG